MKRIIETLLTIKSTGSALKRLTLGLAVSAAVVLGTGLSANAAPANDNFADAINLPGPIGTQTGTDNLDATMETGEPDPGATNTVWFKWICGKDGALTVNTFGSTTSGGGQWDAILGIYSGTALNALTALGTTPLDTGLQETMTVPVTAGTTYYIQLAGWQNALAANLQVNWTLVATIRAEIETFGANVTGSSAVITTTSYTEGTVEWTVPFGSTLAALAPTFTLSPGATCNQPNGAVPTPNFSTSPVHYIVTASDSSTRDYAVTITVGPPSTAADILTFGANVAGSDAEISDTTYIPGTVAWTVPYGSPVTALAPTYTLSFGATCVPASGATKDFTSPQTYTVTAQDGITTKEYTVTATVAPNETALFWNVAGAGDWDLGTPNWIGETSGSILPFYTTAKVIFTNTAGGAINILPNVLPSTTTVSATAGAYTFSGGPIARGSITKSGAGRLNISGLLTGTGTVVPNTYSGGTIMNGGTLHLGGMNAGISPACTGTVGTGPVTLNSGTLQFDRVTETNALIANGGTFYSQNGWGVTWSGPVTLNSNLTCNALYTLTISGAISGTGGLIKTGNGPMNLSGVNSYAGATTVTAGTLNCNNANALGGGALNISGSGKVNLNYTGDHGVPALTLGGVAQQPGSYGSSISGAIFPDDNYFSGSGTVTVAGVLNPLILTFGLPNYPAVIKQDAKTITLRVPYGTDVANLAPTYTVTIGTGTPASGSTQNFTSPVTYVVSSGALTSTYVVTVIVRPQVPPMSITDGLVMWLDASQLTGLTNSEPMTNWTDMSGLGNHATNTAGSPKYKTGALGGQPVVRFVKANGDKFTTTNLSSQFPTAATMLIVSTLRTANAYTLVKTDTGNNHDEWWRYDGNGDSYPAAFRNLRLERYTGMPNSGSHVFAVSSSDSWQMWVDGGSPGAALGNYSPGGAHDIGAGVSGRGLEGDIAEVLSYNRTLSSDELNYLGYYLTAKYDLNTAYTVGSITSFTVPDPLASSVIEGTNIYVTVPSGTALNSLTPTITVSIGATVTPASGVARDFSSPQVTYTLQALDGTTKAYQVTVMDSSKRISGNIGSSASGLEGPAGGGSDSWNDGLGVGAVELMDGSGASTFVGYITGGTSWGGPDAWGTPILELLRQGLRNFSTVPGNSQYITFTNLPYRKYNVYIASANCLRTSSAGNNQRGNGVWSTPNTTSTPGDHKCSNVTLVNGSTWEEGNNYVAFLNVLPDDTGNITINGYGIAVATYDCRLPLNGFQLVDVGVAPLRTRKVMSNVFFPGLGYAYAADSTGTNLLLQVPIGTVVTALAPTFTVSLGATVVPDSGTSHNFTTPVTYIVTAEDLSQQAYKVSVAQVAAGLGYTALIQAAGPVAFWPLGEFTGTTAADITGHGHDAVYSGAFTLGVPGLVPRTSGAAVDFPAAGQAEAPYSTNLNPAQFTVEFWCKPNNLNAAYVVCLQDRNLGRAGWAIQKNNWTSGWDFTFGVLGTSYDTISSPTPLVAGQVYYVAASYDGTTARLYVNGTLANSRVTTYQQTTDQIRGLSIGARNDVSYVNGVLQNVAFYNRALTPQEIQTHYQNTPILKVGMAAGQVILTWEPGIMLQHAAPDVTGTYTNVPTATSPWPITPSGTSEFWRLMTQ